MRGDKINTPENDLHRIFVQDVQNLQKQLGNYLAMPYSTDELIDLMEEYADRWSETVTKIYMEKYKLNTDTEIL
jgi:arsenate reductase-like glutaredoxin family protein